MKNDFQKYRDDELLLQTIADILRCNVTEISERLEKLLTDISNLEAKIAKLKGQLS